jgi:ABC-2 type transport system ATP-binding protein
MKNVNEDGMAIEVRGLTKLFGNFTAVDRITFGVKRGETFGFLGPNGAGKTTTIRMLTGVLKKDGGEASIMGYPAGSIRAKQLSGVMPELSNAYMDLTAWGNIMLMAEIYRIPGKQAKKKSEALLRQLGLHERRDSLASTYSMGMRKRLVLAMALLSDPKLLFLDEPTSGLDVQSVRFIRALLRSLKQQGKTIFLTTHNMDEAAEMCARVAIINHGKIVGLDSPDRLSITAGRVYLVDVSFDKPVSKEVLAGLPGVSRLETAQDIEASERLRAQQVMAGMGAMRGMGGMAGPGQMRMGQGSPGATATMPNKQAAPGENRAAPVEMGKGSRFRLYTIDTTMLVSSLVDFSRANSLQMNILNVRPPSLEDAFIRLTEEKSHGK